MMRSHGSPVYEDRIEQYLHQPSSPKAIAKRKAQMLTTAATSTSTGDTEKAAMLECYCRLRKLVPWLHTDASMSEVELLQHVIDYIQQLQETLASTEEQEVSFPIAVTECMLM